MIAEPAHDQKPTPGRYHIHLNGRDGMNPKLTYDEAIGMYLAGFSFSIFDPVSGVFNVSRPYATIENMERGTLMFVLRE